MQTLPRPKRRNSLPPATRSASWRPSASLAASFDASAPLRIALIVATRGRAAILAQTLRALDDQTRKPDMIIVSCPSEDDLEGIPESPEVVRVIGASGLPRQRNAALERLSADVDIVIFFDDDFIAHSRWISEVERKFRDDADVDAITGQLVADGIKGLGFTVAAASDLLVRQELSQTPAVEEGCSPYGCNMAFRRAAIRDLRFDERLVLYGWLEDRDFGGALARRGGRLIKLGTALGVHLGVKTGRLSGLQLGYSQVVNPIYLYRKGTMTFVSLMEHVGTNVASNLVRSLKPEANIDRYGRLRGNVIALREVLTGVAMPERAEQL